MAERALFFNAMEIAPDVFDREYQAQDFAEYFGSVLSTGLLHTNEIPGMRASVEASTLNTVVSTGKAIMRGHLYENTTPLTLTHSIPEPDLDRIDRIVLRLNLQNSVRDIKLRVLEGEPSENPIAPELTRSQFIHDISLAQIRVRKNTVQLLPSDLVDERLDEEFCGLASSLISIPTDQLQAFINAKRIELDGEMNTALDTYLQSLAAAELELQSDLADWNQQWDDWFTEIQGASFVTGAEFATHLADYEYQTPTIAGTQIQISKQSDSNRLYFKLDADLIGNITISTDNGVTEKPPVDVDGEVITQLEKGFVEVVASAAFFTLRSRGISSSDKQALIEIVNEAEANESDMKSFFVNDINLKDASAGLTSASTWAEVLNGLTNMEMGKKWASGTSKATSGTYDKITVTGLSFTPGIIIAEQTEGSTLRKVYFKDSLIPNANSRSYASSSNAYSSGLWTVSSNGFSANMNEFSGIGATVSWIAFE